ncbi:carboxypeptidase-like regulatory domain-containing protein [Nocardia sp. NPDC058176]|uniref:carboxypeptidase-like regulatory domain-containing protein n=1 Tax=Nocardia sp. NPDC058176 TaxID=3346368 RepID=UPI0036DC53E9
MGLAATALLGAGVGAAAAHPGSGDTVRQSSSCELAGHTRQHELQIRDDSPAAVGQIDAVLVEAGTRKPIAGGKVVLTGVDVCGDSIHRHLSTGTEGQVSFRGLQPGRYRLTAQPTGSMPRATATTDVELTTPSRKTVQFTMG